jgi:hypothetical protein
MFYAMADDEYVGLGDLGTFSALTAAQKLQKQQYLQWQHQAQQQWQQALKQNRQQQANTRKAVSAAEKQLHSQLDATLKSALAAARKTGATPAQLNQIRKQVAAYRKSIPEQAAMQALTQTQTTIGPPTTVYGTVSGLGDLGAAASKLVIQTPYGPLSRTAKVNLNNCPDLFARAQLNFNMAAKHDGNYQTYIKNMNLRYQQYQTCVGKNGGTTYQLDTSADPSAVLDPNAAAVANSAAPPPTALQMTAAIAGGVLTPQGTVQTPTAAQAQQAAASFTAPADTNLFSGKTLVALGVGVAVIAGLIVLMKKKYPAGSQGAPMGV